MPHLKKSQKMERLLVNMMDSNSVITGNVKCLIDLQNKGVLDYKDRIQCLIDKDINKIQDEKAKSYNKD